MILLERQFSAQAPKRNGEMGQKRVAVGQFGEGEEGKTRAIHKLNLLFTSFCYEIALCAV
jgi:hypothetical protein